MENKRIPIFLGISGLGLVVLMALPDKAPATYTGTNLAANLTPVEGPRDEERTLAEQAARKAELDWTRDPFRLAGSPEEPTAALREGEPQPLSTTTLRLSGISVCQNKPMAIIGHDIVQENDRLASGHTVVEITTNSVKLRLDGTTTTLRLGAQR